MVNSIRLFVVVAALSGVAVVAETEPPSSHDVGVHTIDGVTLTGQWLGIEPGVGMRFHAPDGERIIPLDELMRVVFAREIVPASGAVLFHLRDGGSLHGDLVAGAVDGFSVRTAIHEGATVRFDQLVAIQLAGASRYPRAEELFRSAMDDRLPGQDVLITRHASEAKSLRGRLVSLDLNEGKFVFGDRERSLASEKVYGVVFAAGAAKADALPMMATLADGSRFSLQLTGATRDALTGTSSLGDSVTLPLELVAAIDFQSDRLTYISDLPISGQRVEGLLHRPWAVRKNQSVSGKPLSLQGRVFEKGWGVHSRTALDFSLRGAYTTFLATVGIDDAVRPRGGVVFRVLGDDKVLFDGGSRKGGDPPVDVRVDVSSVQNMTLVVDYGDGLDISDHADWADARLIKPRTQANQSRP